MPIIQLIEAADAPMLAQRFYNGGDPGPITKALAHIPELLEVALPFIGTVLGASAIDFRTKEIVILRTSALLQCRYCVETHAVVAHDAALTARQIAALCGEDQAAITAEFPEPNDQTLIAWTDAVAQGPATPAAAVAQALREQVGDADVVELTLLVGATLMLNRFASSLGLPTSAETLQRLSEYGLLTKTAVPA